MKAITLFESPDNIKPTFGPYKGERIYYNDNSYGANRSFIISKDGKAAVVTNPHHHAKGDIGHGIVRSTWKKHSPEKFGAAQDPETFGKWINQAYDRMQTAKMAKAAEQAEKAGEWSDEMLSSAGVGAGAYSHPPERDRNRPGHQFPTRPEIEKRRARRKAVKEGAELATDLVFWPDVRAAFQHFDWQKDQWYGDGNGGRLFTGPKIFTIWNLEREDAGRYKKAIHEVFRLAEQDPKEYWFEFGRENNQKPGVDLWDYNTIFGGGAPKEPEQPAEKPGIAYPTHFEPDVQKDAEMRRRGRSQLMDPEKTKKFLQAQEAISAGDLVARLID